VVLEGFLGRWGNISVEEVCKLALICSWRKPRAIFEFGTYNGMTTLQLALNTLADCIIHTLDVAPDSAEARELDVGEIDAYLVQKTGAFHSRSGNISSSILLQAKSASYSGTHSRLISRLTPTRSILSLSMRGIRSDAQNPTPKPPEDDIPRRCDPLARLHAASTSDVTECLLEYVDRGLKIYHLRGTHLAVHYHQ